MNSHAQARSGLLSSSVRQGLLLLSTLSSMDSFFYRTSLFGDWFNIPFGFFRWLAKAAVPASTHKRSYRITDVEKFGLPAAYLQPRCHPLEAQMTTEVNAYFIKHWPFPNAKAMEKFCQAGFSHMTCCYFPDAKNDRIQFACRLFTLLFLIDGSASGTEARLEG